MWIEKHIIRPYLAFDSVLCEALQHNLPPLVPPPHHPSTTYPLPQVKWDVETAQVPNAASLQGIVRLSMLLIRVSFIYLCWSECRRGFVNISPRSFNFCLF